MGLLSTNCLKEGVRGREVNLKGRGLGGGANLSQHFIVSQLGGRWVYFLRNSS